MNVTFNEDECYKDLLKETSEKNTEFLDIELGYVTTGDTNSGGGISEQPSSTNNSSSGDHEIISVDSDTDDAEDTESIAVAGNLDNYLLARDRVRRLIKAPDRHGEGNCVLFAMLASEDGDPPEPSDFRAAMRDPRKDKWKFEADEEIDSLDKNLTWILVNRPLKRKIIGCKWIFKRKYGIPVVKQPRFKAILVAKSFAQNEGIDYNEIFSPVVKHVSIRYLMSIVVNEDLELE